MAKIDLEQFGPDAQRDVLVASVEKWGLASVLEGLALVCAHKSGRLSLDLLDFPKPSWMLGESACIKAAKEATAAGLYV